MWGGGRVGVGLGNKNKQTKKKHASDATGAPALSVENMKTRRTTDQAEEKLWRCADKAHWPQDAMKQTLKRLLAAAIPSLWSAHQICFAVKMVQNFLSQMKLVFFPMSCCIWWNAEWHFSQSTSQLRWISLSIEGVMRCFCLKLGTSIPYFFIWSNSWKTAHY